MSRTNLRDRDNFYKSIDVIVISFYIALIVSIIFILVVQFFPTKVIYIGTILGLLMLLASIICVILYKTNHTKAKIVILVILVLLFLFSLLTTWKNPNSLRMHSIFLKWATVMVKNRILTVLYIPIFMIVLTLFICLLVFEFTGFWTSGHI